VIENFNLDAGVTRLSKEIAQARVATHIKQNKPAAIKKCLMIAQPL
jgi:hypothetical protein